MTHQLNTIEKLLVGTQFPTARTNIAEHYKIMKSYRGAMLDKIKKLKALNKICLQIFSERNLTDEQRANLEKIIFDNNLERSSLGFMSSFDQDSYRKSGARALHQPSKSMVDPIGIINQK